MIRKDRPEELAILGGTPAFDEKLHVGRPNIGNRERLLERINDLLDRRWLTNDGPYVGEFEREVAKLLDVRHCVAVCNATLGLEIAIKAMGLAGEVIVPSFTFIATAHALQWQGITPVFCDIDPATHNLDPQHVEALITPRTTGILGVHLWGRPCEVDALAQIARRHNLGLMFDAAHAFGCSHRGRMIGNFGNAEVFSFHATKFFNTFEGGVVATNDAVLAQKVRLMRNFGFTGYDEVSSIGTNGKMNEVSAAMGLTSLESLNEFVAVNRCNYERYKKGLSGIPGIHVSSYDETEKCNYQYIVLEIEEAYTGIDRDDLVQILWAENVIARRYFYPGCHRMEPYRSYYPDVGLRLPATERLAERVLQLPTGTAVGSDHISAICRLVKMVTSPGPTVRKRLSGRETAHGVGAGSKRGPRDAR
jgi:dTDP-4-amino-4,6-dideoxygalactose transaminase